MVCTMLTYGPRPPRNSGVSGLVGSHGRSQSALRTRMSRHVAASRIRNGRKPTGPSTKVTGQPRIRSTNPMIPCSGGRMPSIVHSGSITPWVISTANLIHRVNYHRPEHGHTVPHSPGRARKIHDERAAGDTGEPTRQDRRGDLVTALEPDRLGDAGHLALDQPAGHLGR